MAAKVALRPEPLVCTLQHMMGVLPLAYIECSSTVKSKFEVLYSEGYAITLPRIAVVSGAQALYIQAEHEGRCGRAGSIACSVQGPLDKGNILEDILLDIAAASGDGSAPCVYVGDSVGDLSSLLVANRPVVLGHNPMLQHALRTFG